MLLDANSPASDPPPAPLPDRPARVDGTPRHRADALSSGDQGGGSNRSSASDSGSTQNVQPAKVGSAGVKNTDGIKSTGGKAGAKVDSKNAGKDDSGAANDESDNGQDSTGAADSGAPVIAAISPIGIASAPPTASADNTPAPPADGTSDAPPVSPAAAFAAVIPTDTPSDVAAPQSGQPNTNQSQPDSKSTDAGAPIDLGKKTAAAAFADIAPQAPKTEPADPIKTYKPGVKSDGDASDAAADNTTISTQDAPIDAAKPDQKIPQPREFNLGAPTEPTAPVSTAMPMTTVASASPAATIAPTNKFATPATIAPVLTGDVPAAAKLQSAPAPVKIENANANPPNGIHGVSVKADGTKPDSAKADSEPESDRIHHVTSERIPGPDVNAIPAGRVGTQSNTASGTNDSMSSGASALMPQTTTAPVPAAAAFISATPAAVPLAAVPIEIATQAKDGKNRFEIRLDPPELGRIDVRLDIDNKGIVTSRLMADRPETLDLLRRDAPQIERALQDAGLKTNDQGMQFSLRDQSFAGRNDSALPPAAQLVLPDDDTMPLEAARQGYGRLFGLGGGIDIRV